MDIDSAYLNATLNEPIYLKQPLGSNKGNNVLLLKKALYGLKNCNKLYLSSHRVQLNNDQFYWFAKCTVGVGD
jgi:hypothetical protein